MAKRTKRNKTNKSVPTKIRRLETADERLIKRTVEDVARNKGIFVVESYSATEGEFEGEAPGSSRVVRNRGGTALDRWRANGSIDDRQMAAILIFTRLHNRVFGSPRRVIANYNQAATASAYIAEEVFNHNVMQAKETLADIQRFVWQWNSFEDKWAFENVVLHDQTCAEAGILIGEENKNARITAVKRAVISIANQLAALLIDPSKRNHDNPRPILDRVDRAEFRQAMDEAA